METDEINLAILQKITTALKTPGKFLFTTLNGLFPLFHFIDQFLANPAEGTATYQDNTFDLMTFCEHSITEVEDDFGNKKALEINQHYYVPSEITRATKNFMVPQYQDIWG